MKIRNELTKEEVQDVLDVIEREIAGYSQTHPPERVVRLRSAVEKLKS